MLRKRSEQREYINRVQSVQEKMEHHRSRRLWYAMKNYAALYLCVWLGKSCYADKCDSDKYRTSMEEGTGSDAVCLEKHDQALSATNHQLPNHQGCRHRNAHDVSHGRPSPGGEPVLLSRLSKRPLHEHTNTCKIPETILRRGVRQTFLISSEHNPERQTREAVHRLTRACMSKQPNRRAPSLRVLPKRRMMMPLNVDDSIRSHCSSCRFVRRNTKLRR
jgi:hypothetical protein